MNLSLSQGKLQIELEWFEQLWACTLHKVIELPLDHITRVTIEEPQSNWAEIRSPGTSISGVIKAGTYYTKQGRDFWYVTTDRNYLTLELREESYRRIILTLPNPESSLVWMERINQSRMHSSDMP